MSYHVYRAARGYQPLYCMPEGLIVLRGRSLYRADLDLTRFSHIADLPHEKAIGRIPSRLVARIFRLGADTAALIDDNWLLVARRNKIFRVSLATGEWHVDLVLPDGVRLLNLSEIIDRAGERVVCFGEYVTAFDDRPVKVWRRSLNPGDGWSVSGAFDAGEIDHIHNIHQTSDGSVYLLAGDFGERAGIWRSDGALARFTPVLRGSQSVRACWVWESAGDTLFFATDSQFEPNHLRMLSDGKTADVTPIAGSSIYSYSDPERVVFSTTVEPGALSGHRLRDILDRRPGPGISGDTATINVFAKGRMTTVLRAKKDRWPMRLAQFGTFRFPAGRAPPDRFFAYGAGVETFDGTCLLMKRESGAA